MLSEGGVPNNIRFTSPRRPAAFMLAAPWAETILKQAFVQFTRSLSVAQALLGGRNDPGVDDLDEHHGRKRACLVQPSEVGRPVPWYAHEIRSLVRPSQRAWSAIVRLKLGVEITHSGEVHDSFARQLDA